MTEDFTTGLLNRRTINKNTVAEREEMHINPSGVKYSKLSLKAVETVDQHKMAKPAYR